MMQRGADRPAADQEVLNVTRVVMYGVGSGCERVMRNLSDDAEIVAFVDSKKAGQLFQNEMIHGPEQLASISFDYVLVCSQYFGEIYTTLVQLGIDPGKILNAINYIMEHPEQTRFNTENVIITGMSYAFGLKEELIKATNLASSSQDLLFNLCTVEEYLASYEPEFALIGITYFSFSYDLFKTLFSSPSKHQTALAARLQYIRHRLEVHAPDKYNKTKGMEWTEVFNDVEALRNLITIRSRENVEDSTIGRGLSEKRAILAERHGRIFPVTEHENIEIMDKLLKLLETRGVYPIFVVTPQHEEYRRHFPIESVQRFYQIMDHFKGKYSFKMIDLFDEPMEDDYWRDEDHLNGEGNIKLTKVLMSKLER